MNRATPSTSGADRKGGLTPEWEQRAGKAEDRHGLRRLHAPSVLRVVLRDETLPIGNSPGPEERPGA